MRVILLSQLYINFKDNRKGLLVFKQAIVNRAPFLWGPLYLISFSSAIHLQWLMVLVNYFLLRIILSLRL